MSWKNLIKNKYFGTSLIFLIVGLIILYKIFTIPSPNNYGSLIIAWASIYAMIVTNFKNNDNNALQLEETRNVLYLQTRKDEIKESLKKLRLELEKIIDDRAIMKWGCLH